MADAELNIDNIIARLLEARGRPGKTVQMVEAEVSFIYSSSSRITGQYSGSGTQNHVFFPNF